VISAIGFGSTKNRLRLTAAVRLRHLRGPGESYSDVIIVLRGVAKSEFSEATRRPASGLRLSIGL
jgi:hypothetical protein